MTAAILFDAIGAPGLSASPVSPVASEAGEAQHYVFLLLDQFTHLALSCAVEPLRLANHSCGSRLYSWETCSETGQPIQASNGISLVVDGGLRPLAKRDVLVVVGGKSPRRDTGGRLMAYVRRQQAHGVRLIALCGATGVLAQARVIQDQPCAVHWESSDAFAERFPEVEVVVGTFTLERVPTAAGGAAVADLMLHLIARDHGSDLAGLVADQMIYSGSRGPQTPQTNSMQERLALRHGKLGAVLRVMSANLEEPLAMADISKCAGMSARQIERLFRSHLRTTPKRHYMQLRMKRAQNLILQTDMPITDIALACGFTSSSHFSKKYREHVGQTAFRHRVAYSATPA